MIELYEWKRKNNNNNHLTVYDWWQFFFFAFFLFRSTQFSLIFFGSFDVWKLNSGDADVFARVSRRKCLTVIWHPSIIACQIIITVIIAKRKWNWKSKRKEKKKKNAEAKQTHKHCNEWTVIVNFRCYWRWCCAGKRSNMSAYAVIKYDFLYFSVAFSLLISKRIIILVIVCHQKKLSNVRKKVLKEMMRCGETGSKCVTLKDTMRQYTYFILRHFQIMLPEIKSTTDPDVNIIWFYMK